MLIRIESKVGNSEIVENVLTRMEVSDLYVKLEKCKWKVRKVGFLGVVIGPDGIKIEKKTMKVVLD